MSYQNITIVGNVGSDDPQLRYTPSGIAVTDFSVAVNRSYTKDDGTKVEQVTWYRVTCWRRQAEVVAQYVKKGRQVMVIASQVEANAYAGRDGEPRASLDVTADQVIFLQGGDAGQSGGSASYDADTSSLDAINSSDIPF